MGNHAREGTQREDTALTGPAPVARLQKSGFLNSNNTRGLPPRINEEQPPVSAVPYLSYVDEDDGTDGVFTTLWCLYSSLGGKNEA